MAKNKVVVIFLDVQGAIHFLVDDDHLAVPELEDGSMAILLLV